MSDTKDINPFGPGPIVVMDNETTVESIGVPFRLTAEQAIREVLGEFDEVKGYYIESATDEGRASEAAAAIAVASVLARLVRKGLSEEGE